MPGLGCNWHPLVDHIELKTPVELQSSIFSIAPARQNGSLSLLTPYSQITKKNNKIENKAVTYTSSYTVTRLFSVGESFILVRM